MSMVMRSLGGFVVCVMLVCTATFAEAAGGPLTFFSDEPIVDLSNSTRPPSADDVTVAKVRVVGGPSGLSGRDQSGLPSDEKPRELWSTWLKVLDVVRGKRPERELVNVTFGDVNLHTYALGPTTPRQLAQEYYVAMYEDASGFHLIGVPINSFQYRDWRREIHEFARKQLKSPPK